MRTSHRQVSTIMGGHFIAAFAALGMPPFFGLILERSLGSGDTWLAGWLYVLPTFFMAVSSPFWGRLADRFGKKALLLRAQLGLALSFLLAGLATTPAAFAAALILQGLLGGTFSASNAYLSTLVSGNTLARCLTLMQGSARAALVAAPLVIGALVTDITPIRIYFPLALLPLLAALLIWRQSPNPAPQAAESRREMGPSPASWLSARRIFGLQFGFQLATVLTFPYFVPFVVTSLGESTAVAGFLFGLPHLVYLVAAAPLSVFLKHRNSAVWLAAGLGLIALSMLAQPHCQNALALGLWRLLMGLGLTATFIQLHMLIAGSVQAGSAGRTFGWFESSAKWGAVAAGLMAGVLSYMVGVTAPFYASALILGATVLILLLPAHFFIRHLP